MLEENREVRLQSSLAICDGLFKLVPGQQGLDAYGWLEGGGGWQ